MKIFSDWKTAKENPLFKTRSPFPNVPCYISQILLPTCANFSSYLPLKCSLREIKEYLESQVFIVRYNNPGFTTRQTAIVISLRIAYWHGNEILRKDAYYLDEMLPKVIEECYNKDDFASNILMDYIKYWYSDDIESLSGEDNGFSKKIRAKQFARNALIAKDHKEYIKTVADEYTRLNYDVKPTIMILVKETTYSRPTITKYGKDFYIKRKANIEQRVIRARIVYPYYSQQKIAGLLNESERTVRMYWKSI